MPGISHRCLLFELTRARPQRTIHCPTIQATHRTRRVLNRMFCACRSGNVFRPFAGHRDGPRCDGPAPAWRHHALAIARNSGRDHPERDIPDSFLRARDSRVYRKRHGADTLRRIRVNRFRHRVFQLSPTCGAVGRRQMLALKFKARKALRNAKPESKRASDKVARGIEHRHCANRRTTACAPCATGPAIAMPSCQASCVRGSRSCGPS